MIRRWFLRTLCLLVIASGLFWVPILGGGDAQANHEWRLWFELRGVVFDRRTGASTVSDALIDLPTSAWSDVGFLEEYARLGQIPNDSRLRWLGRHAPGAARIFLRPVGSIEDALLNTVTAPGDTTLAQELADRYPIRDPLLLGYVQRIEDDRGTRDRVIDQALQRRVRELARALGSPRDAVLLGALLPLSGLRAEILEELSRYPHEPGMNERRLLVDPQNPAFANLSFPSTGSPTEFFGISEVWTPRLKRSYLRHRHLVARFMESTDSRLQSTFAEAEWEFLTRGNPGAHLDAIAASAAFRDPFGPMAALLRDGLTGTQFFDFASSTEIGADRRASAWSWLAPESTGAIEWWNQWRRHQIPSAQVQEVSRRTVQVTWPDRRGQPRGLAAFFGGDGLSLLRVRSDPQADTVRAAITELGRRHFEWNPIPTLIARARLAANGIEFSPARGERTLTPSEHDQMVAALRATQVPQGFEAVMTHDEQQALTRRFNSLVSARTVTARIISAEHRQGAISDRALQRLRRTLRADLDQETQKWLDAYRDLMQRLGRTEVAEVVLLEAQIKRSREINKDSLHRELEDLAYDGSISDALRIEAARFKIGFELYCRTVPFAYRWIDQLNPFLLQGQIAFAEQVSEAAIDGLTYLGAFDFRVTTFPSSWIFSTLSYNFLDILTTPHEWRAQREAQITRARESRDATNTAQLIRTRNWTTAGAVLLGGLLQLGRANPSVSLQSTGLSTLDAVSNPSRSLERALDTASGAVSRLGRHIGIRSGPGNGVGQGRGTSGPDGSDQERMNFDNDDAESPTSLGPRTSEVQIDRMFEVFGPLARDGLLLLTPSNLEDHEAWNSLELDRSHVAPRWSPWLEIIMNTEPDAPQSDLPRPVGMRMIGARPLSFNGEHNATLDVRRNPKTGNLRLFGGAQTRIVLTYVAATSGLESEVRVHDPRAATIHVDASEWTRLQNLARQAGFARWASQLHAASATRSLRDLEQATYSTGDYVDHVAPNPRASRGWHLFRNPFHAFSVYQSNGGVLCGTCRRHNAFLSEGITDIVDHGSSQIESVTFQAGHVLHMDAYGYYSRPHIVVSVGMRSGYPVLLDGTPTRASRPIDGLNSPEIPVDDPLPARRQILGRTTIDLHPVREQSRGREEREQGRLHESPATGADTLQMIRWLKRLSYLWWWRRTVGWAELRAYWTRLDILEGEIPEAERGAPELEDPLTLAATEQLEEQSQDHARPQIAPVASQGAQTSQPAVEIGRAPTPTVNPPMTVPSAQDRQFLQNWAEALNALHVARSAFVEDDEDAAAQLRATAPPGMTRSWTARILRLQTALVRTYQRSGDDPTTEQIADWVAEAIELESALPRLRVAAAHQLDTMTRVERVRSQRRGRPVNPDNQSVNILERTAALRSAQWNTAAELLARLITQQSQSLTQNLSQMQRIQNSCPAWWQLHQDEYTPARPFARNQKAACAVRFLTQALARQENLAREIRIRRQH